MVFPTISAYLDQANYWQQSPNYQNGSNVSLPPPQQSIPLPQPHGAGSSGSIRPGSMADRARISNIPIPETAQKCPRCESTNTKFCYFNNYSLSQPRHFCKTCRRYWTSGGALRNVPVGGGYRRNKRSNKAISSNNISKSDQSTHSETTSVSTTSNLHSNPTSSILGGLTSQFPQLRFTTPMSHLNDHYGGGEIGMNYSNAGISTPVGITREMPFPSNLYGTGGGEVGSVLSSGGRLEQWRMQQQLGHRFPNFLGGFDPTQGAMLYGNNNYYQSGGFEIGLSGYAGSKFSNDSVLSQTVSSPKMEGNNNNNIINRNNEDDEGHESNIMGRPFLGSSSSTCQWNASTTTASAWTNLSGFSNAL